MQDLEEMCPHMTHMPCNKPAQDKAIQDVNQKIVVPCLRAADGIASVARDQRHMLSGIACCSYRLNTEGLKEDDAGILRDLDEVRLGSRCKAELHEPCAHMCLHSSAVRSFEATQ